MIPIPKFDTAMSHKKAAQLESPIFTIQRLMEFPRQSIVSAFEGMDIQGQCLDRSCEVIKTTGCPMLTERNNKSVLFIY